MIDNRLLEPIEHTFAGLGDWDEVVGRWRGATEGRRLMAFVSERQAAGAVIYPGQVFRALRETQLARTRVVILGQDPYHRAGQAEGLAFSVPAGQKLPPSLRNILAELRRDLGLLRPASGHLGGWARQGVLLLNTSLTVEEGAPARHARQGWEALTDALITAAAFDAAPKVFMLWGAHAQAKRPLVEAAGHAHRVLSSNHPSPLSATRPPVPFIGCGHFSQANSFLQRSNRSIDWSQAA